MLSHLTVSKAIERVPAKPEFEDGWCSYGLVQLNNINHQPVPAKQ
jgi:hypothetical protein